MKKLKRYILSYCVILLINLFCLQYSQATPPGKSINKLKEKELTVTLYVLSIASESSNLRGVEFLWIPDSIEEQCVTQSYQYCKDLSRSLKNKLLDKYPRRVLTNWVAEGDSRIFPENKQILEELSKIDFIRKLIKELKGEHHFDLIEKDRKIKARVHWELWPNGENFRVIKIIVE